MLKKRATALPNSPSFQQLWEALGAKLMETANGSMSSKQWVESSSLSRDATNHVQEVVNCSQKFTKEILDKFLSSRESGTSLKTAAIYHLALDRFIGYPLTPEGINSYLNYLTCGNAKHNYYRCIKTLCRWLYDTGQLPTNPIEKVLPPRRQKKLLPAISKEQLDILVNHAVIERDKVILNLLWYSGMRLSEAAGVKVRTSTGMRARL
jgi:site-specific recombinase XerD